MNKLLAVVVMTLVIPATLCAQGSERGQQQREQNRVRHAADAAQRNEAKARRAREHDAWIPARPLVQRDGKRWVAPVYPRDAFHLDHPWQAGRFTRGVGPRYLWQLKGGNRERFGMGGGWFALAPADYAHADGWHWGDDEVVIYPDTDHDGWYLAYNTRLGTYTHVRFLGY